MVVFTALEREQFLLQTRSVYSNANDSIQVWFICTKSLSQIYMCDVCVYLRRDKERAFYTTLQCTRVVISLNMFQM